MPTRLRVADVGYGRAGGWCDPAVWYSSAIATGIAFGLEIPAGALSAPTSITLREITSGPPLSYVDYSPVYVVEPVDISFAVPVKVTVPWLNAELTVAGDLAIHRADSSRYVPMGRLSDSYVNANFLQATIEFGGQFFAGYPRTGETLDCR